MAFHLEKRVELLKSWGTLEGGDNNVIAPLIGGRLMGRPSWPNREAFRVLTRADGKTKILVTDGLSDEISDESEYAEKQWFLDESGVPRNVGLGLELWMESDELMDEPTHQTWMFPILSTMAYNVCEGEFQRSMIERYKRISSEFYVDGLSPNFHIDPEYISPEGTIGLLIGLESSDRSETYQVDDYTVRYYNIRIITAKELERVRNEERDQLVEELQVKQDRCISRLGSNPNQNQQTQTEQEKTEQQQMHSSHEAKTEAPVTQ